MAEYYRFRNIERLIGGEYLELEQQIIYFASPEQLNDPMEGLRDIVWHGDKVVWTNLFKNYVYCLHRTYLDAKLFGNDFKIEPEIIPVWGRWDEPETPQMSELFDDCWDRVLRKTGLDRLVDKIAETQRRARFSELLFYLNFIHRKALARIQEVHVEQGLAPEVERPQHRGTLSPLGLGDSVFFELLPQVEAEHEDFSEVTGSIVNEMLSESYLEYKYIRRNATDRILEQNRQLLFLDFPRVYLEQLQRILWPQWYAACFSRSFHNSSLWGNYGDKHKGACLIFEADESENLPLEQVVGWSSNPKRSGENIQERWDYAPMHFYDVSYADRVGEVEFFKSIGRVPVSALMQLWYIDEDGNVSESASHVANREVDEEHWRRNYWDSFKRDITVKTQDWEYEQESRLILYGLLDDVLDERRRKLKFDFNSLKGIIFGIRTSDQDKMKIIEVIEKKCREIGRTDFKFYQAYYSHRDGDIQRREINLEFS